MSKRTFFHYFVAALLVFTPAAFSAFDPVNDDTDIFLANPNYPAERPNVLIVLDNTANWNTAFTNEKAALVQVVNGLNDQFNVGLMMFPETGGGNDSVDGGYVRFAVRQMTTANKAALSTLVNNLDINGDKGNNATTGLALYEAYLYYAGLNSRASHGKVKTDKDGTTDTYLAGLSNRALAAGTTPSAYRSPIVDGCQRNFIIYISNGPAAENASARATLEGYLATLTGVNPPSTIAIHPSGQQANWADEMARYMANADINTQANTQNVYSYVVEVNPGTTGQQADMTALMKSVASNGKGRYFGVTSDASGTAIVDALNAIFTEVQAVNSVFASTTLPVSVNVRGTNLNQVYIGVFRPDPNKAPRWLGNLKMYNLALNSSTGRVFLADASNGPPPATGLAAENTTTGFVTGSASSFWTENSSFWSFRDPSQNGVGGPSDKPDGDLVEKGGAAQQLRLQFPLAEAETTKRKVYTCTTGMVDGVNQTCTTNSPLANTPFSTLNAAIDATSLQLDARLVSPLSAFQTRTITSLTDRKAVTLSNAASPVSVLSLTNGANTRTITNLTTATQRTVTNLTALVAGTQTINITSITRSGTTCTVNSASTLPSGFVAGASVSFTGVGNSSDVNGTSKTINATGLTSTSFQTGGCGNKSPGTGGTASVSGTANSTTATATLTDHGFIDGQAVTISGAAPAQFNVANAFITVVDAHNFRYTLGTAAGAATGTILAAGNTLNATATTSAAHGITAGSFVTISGANPTEYNGTFKVNTASGSVFTYTVPSRLGTNTASPVYASTGASTTVTVTTALAHGFINNQSVTISNSDISGYNGSFVIDAVTATTFTYTTASALPANTSATVTASTGFLATVTATAASHGFATGDTVVIEGAAPHAGQFVPITKIDDNTFTFANFVLASPSGSYTVRPPALSTRAIATIPTHGYGVAGSTLEIVVSGANPAGYNGTHTATVVDANTVRYPLTSPPGPNTSVVAAASVKTTTARATAVAHGFANGSQVTVSGATPGAFNGGPYTIAVLDANTFTYTIGTPQGDATGTIVAGQAGTGGTERNNIINWVRGEDNFQDENLNLSTTDIRASVHGDVLHSRPAVVNYNRFGSDDDVYVFYGANDGIFHAIKGGYATDAADPDGLAPGREAWGFIPQEFFGQFKRMRNNSPSISSSFKKPYFADGPIGIYTKDTNNNGKLGDVGATPDIVNLYVAMRRGGRFIYALDVNVPTNPKFLWKIDNTTAGFSELGQTWSEPKVISGLAGLTSPVLVFGAGYDPAVEDLDPASITASTAASVTTAAGTVNRTMGRGIYVVNALTGAKIWSAGPAGSGHTLTVSGMDYAIPSDITVIRNESGGPTNRAYVGDTGGNMWRIDFSGVNLATTTVTKLAAIGNHATAAGRRKFMFAPDVVGQTGFDAVLAGSGDREHPFDATVVNRMYMFKDKGTDAGAITGTSVANPTIVESALFDATSNCIQDAAACASGVTSADAQATLSTQSGWYITLSTGEKVVGNAVSIAGTTFFNTNQPSASAGGGTCGSNLGVARQYQVATADATATADLNATGGLSVADRSLIHAGGGYLPSPVHVVVMLGGKPVEAVISGIQVSTPAGATLQARLRKYWYKEID